MRAHNSSWIPLELFVGNRGQMWPLVEDFCSQLAVSINPHKNASIQKRLLWPLINMIGSQSDGDVLLTFFSSITSILRLFLSLMCHNHNFFIYFFYSLHQQAHSVPVKLPLDPLSGTVPILRQISCFMDSFLKISSWYSPKNMNFPLKHKQLLSCKSYCALVLSLSLFLISEIVGIIS